MATSKKAQTPVQKPAFESVKWINRNLTDDEKEEHDALKLDPKEVYKDLMGLVLSGYNISIKYDAYSRGYQATLLPYDPTNVNYGYGISARSSDPYRAVSLLLFKHFKVLQQEWVASYKAPTNSFEG